MICGKFISGVVFPLCLLACEPAKHESNGTPENVLLKDFKPVSLFNIPVTPIEKAKFPLIDMHTHGRYAKTREEVEAWVKVMNATGVEKAIVLTQAHGEEFDKLVDLYSLYPDRFELWCGFDYTGYNKPGYGPDAVNELVRCFEKGARGVE